MRVTTFRPRVIPRPRLRRIILPPQTPAADDDVVRDPILTVGVVPYPR